MVVYKSCNRTFSFVILDQYDLDPVGFDHSWVFSLFQRRPHRFYVTPNIKTHSLILFTPLDKGIWEPFRLAGQHRRVGVVPPDPSQQEGQDLGSVR